MRKMKAAVMKKVMDYRMNNHDRMPNTLLISEDIKILILMDNSDLLLLKEFVQNKTYMGMDVLVCFNNYIRDYLEVVEI
jgi:hypothetical protein